MVAWSRTLRAPRGARLSRTVIPWNGLRKKIPHMTKDMTGSSVRLPATDRPQTWVAEGHCSSVSCLLDWYSTTQLRPQCGSSWHRLRAPMRSAGTTDSFSWLRSAWNPVTLRLVDKDYMRHARIGWRRMP
jgi:hypothetical protein